MGDAAVLMRIVMYIQGLLLHDRMSVSLFGIATTYGDIARLSVNTGTALGTTFAYFGRS